MVSSLLNGTTTSIGKISVYKHCFCYSNMPTTGNEANDALVGTLMTIGDVNDISPIKILFPVNGFVGLADITDEFNRRRFDAF